MSNKQKFQIIIFLPQFYNHTNFTQKITFVFKICHCAMAKNHHLKIQSNTDLYKSVSPISFKSLLSKANHNNLTSGLKPRPGNTFMSRPKLISRLSSVSPTFLKSRLIYKFSNIQQIAIPRSQHFQKFLSQLPYARHYNPRFVYFSPPFLKAKNVYLGSFFVKFLCTVSIQKRFIIKSGL